VPEGYVIIKLVKLNFITAWLECVSTFSFCLNDKRFDSMIIYNLTVKDWLTTANYMIDLVISAIHEK
jgi:hypothetical protein